ncbi:hypothetical protein [[Erwinia] mediterraneensis]|uniref:hypothetical protein n=1 Tax=[Erwinia] mediterraneensis TaxID=2161819 RepID=UPI00103078F5|nr:hypothetical protein [[Erwinia] mediterraneensis]
MNTGVIGQHGRKFMLNVQRLMAGTEQIEKGISATKKIVPSRKKILKVGRGETITGLTAMKPTG